MMKVEKEDIIFVVIIFGVIFMSLLSSAGYAMVAMTLLPSIFFRHTRKIFILDIAILITLIIIVATTIYNGFEITQEQASIFFPLFGGYLVLRASINSDRIQKEK